MDARTARGEHSRISAAQRFAAVQRLAFRHHLVDEAERLALGRRHPPPGQDHAERLLLPDHARQAVHAAGPGDQPDARFGQGEDGVLGGDDEVAGERDLEAATHGNAIHRGDHRLVEVMALGQAGEAGGRRRPALAGGLHLQIVAGGKGAVAGARHDGDPQIRVGGELVPDLVEFLMRLAVQGVHHLRPVQRDDAQPAFILHDAVAIGGHGCCSLRLSRLPGPMPRIGPRAQSATAPILSVAPNASVQGAQAKPAHAGAGD